MMVVPNAGSTKVPPARGRTGGGASLKIRRSVITAPLFGEAAAAGRVWAEFAVAAAIIRNVAFKIYFMICSLASGQSARAGTGFVARNSENRGTRLILPEAED